VPKYTVAMRWAKPL